MTLGNLEHITIGDIFSDDSLHGLVYDFFHARMNETDPPKAEDILLQIFSDNDLFRRFLLFFKETNTNISDKEKSIFFFQSMLYLREIHGNHVNHILNVTLDKVYSMMKTVHMHDADDIQWDSLERSIQNNMPINNRGEVIYTLEDIPGGYKVFSFESRVHEVNYNGEVVRDNLRNKAERCNVRSKILRYEKFEQLLYEDEITDENDKKIARAIMEEFEQVFSVSWREIMKDEREERLYALKLRFYIHTQLSIYKKAFRVLQDEDDSSQKNIVLVGGKYVGDGTGIKANIGVI